MVGASSERKKHLFTVPNPGADQEFIEYFTMPYTEHTLKNKVPMRQP